MPVIEHDGETIGYRVLEASGAGTGRPVVLLHNLLLDERVWDQVAVGLSGGRRVVLVAARGHEGSSARRRFGVDDLAGDVLAVLDGLGLEMVDVAGVSLGASVALGMVARAPARVGRVALLAANPFRPATRDALETTGLALAVRLLGFQSWLRRRALEVLFGPTFRAARPEVVAAWEARMVGRPGVEVWRAVRAWVRRPDATPALAGLAGRALVVAGSEDAAAPPAVAARVAAAIPGARAVTVEATGHSLPTERPAQVLELLRAFLSAPP